MKTRIFACIFSIYFLFMSSFIQPQTVRANSLGLAAVEFTAGVVLTTEPQILLAIVLLSSLGVSITVANAPQILSAFDKSMQEAGKAFTVLADGTVKVASDTLSWIKSWVASLTASPTSASDVSMQESLTNSINHFQINIPENGGAIPIDYPMNLELGTYKVTLSVSEGTLQDVYPHVYVHGKSGHDSEIVYPDAVSPGAVQSFTYIVQAFENSYVMTPSGIVWSMPYGALNLQLGAQYRNTGSICVDLNVTPSADLTADVINAHPDSYSDSVAETASTAGASDLVFTPKVQSIPMDWTGNLSDLGTLTDSNTDTQTSNPDMDIDSAKQHVVDKFNLPRFQKSWDLIKNMDTSRGDPPKITFNMNALFTAATSRFGSPSNPFSSAPTTLIDFGMLQNYDFMGLPLIDYFRGLVGTGFIITTFLYVWRKITGGSAIGG